MKFIQNGVTSSYDWRDRSCRVLIFIWREVQEELPRTEYNKENLLVRKKILKGLCNNIFWRFAVVTCNVRKE